MIYYEIRIKIDARKGWTRFMGKVYTKYWTYTFFISMFTCIALKKMKINELMASGD